MIKNNMNLWYCFSCGYSVNHNGFQCPAKKPNHIENVRREDAHKVMGACMKAAHKMLNSYDDVSYYGCCY